MPLLKACSLITLISSSPQLLADCPAREHQFFVLIRDRADIVGRSPYCIWSVYSFFSSATSDAFLGTFPYPKFQKFLAAHSDCRKIHEIATFPTFHIQKRSLAPPTGFTRYNTPPNSKSLQILHICADKCALQNCHWDY